MTGTTANTASGIGLRKFSLWVLIAGLANVAVFLAGQAAGASMTVNALEINVAMALFATVALLAIAGLVTSLISRRHPGFLGTARWLGLVFGLVTAGMPLYASADVTTGVSLALMHVFAGLSWYLGIKR